MRHSLYASMVLFLAACAVGEDYKKPPNEIDPNWHALEEKKLNEVTPAEMGPKAPWWLQFGDNDLSQLMADGLSNNNDLKVAQARVDEARANESGAVAGLFPNISATGNVTRQHYPASSGNVIDNTSQYGVNGTWDLDIFGSNRRRAEAAGAAAESEEAKRDKTRIDLLAEVARNYVLLRSLQQQHALTVKNLSMQKDTLKVTQGQRDEGAVSDLEVARARAQVGTTEAKLPQIKTQEFAALNRLCVLTGQKYDTLKYLADEKRPIPQTAANIVKETPVKTIEERPDVRSAERDLASNTALTGAALADFFPKLSLQGFFGPNTSQFFGNSTPWNIALNGAMPLLDFGRLSSQLDAADAKQQQSFYTYQQTILLAVEDTENAFAAYIHEQQRRDSLQEAATEQAKAAEVAKEQYRSGVTTQLDLLLAENDQLQAETDLTLSEQTVAENIIKLHHALGDGINDQY